MRSKILRITCIIGFLLSAVASVWLCCVVLQSISEESDRLSWKKIPAELVHFGVEKNALGQYCAHGEYEYRYRGKTYRCQEMGAYARRDIRNFLVEYDVDVPHAKVECYVDLRHPGSAALFNNYHHMFMWRFLGGLAAVGLAAMAIYLYREADRWKPEVES